jgi:DNA-binding NtrC family response regulator
LRRLIEKLGDCRWPALLLGESGTGKEVVARAIHTRRNAGGSFVIIDCSSMVGPLLESELFGRVKGAFTDAANAEIGLIEAADGGTAFFDEVGDLPLDLQAKLLRVLQEKEFRPVGSTTTRRSDFRIIAATNRDLGADVETGAFRRDLYFRLNVIKVRLAPLRERKEDIPILISHFLLGTEVSHTITAEAMEVILSYDWPGNVRELENCVHHMMAMNSEPLLHTSDLPSSLQQHLLQKKSQYLTAAVGASLQSPLTRKPPERADRTASPPVRVQDPAAIIPLLELERQAIFTAMEYTKGDRASAALLLGIGRTTLYRKLKEYEIAS